MEINNWLITENILEQETYQENNTIFSLANGYFGTRGNVEEKTNLQNNDGTFINGFYDKENFIYPNSSICQAKERQKMLFAPQAKDIFLAVNNENINPEGATSFTRQLNMENALLTKTYEVNINNVNLNVTSERIVSLTHENLMMIKTTIIADADCELTIDSPSTYFKVFANEGHLSRKTRMIKQDPLHLVEKLIDADHEDLVQFKTDASELSLYFGVKFDFSNKVATENFGSYKINLKANEEFTFVKKVYYNWTNFDINAYNKEMNLEFTSLLAEQTEELNKFWAVSDIKVKDNPELQAAMRFNVFSLFQNSGRNGITNVCAKGLTGEGYDGHYFWDTEIFVLPYFTFNKPEIAKALLMYRYNTLNIAKERAAELSYDGALFPWRTINGVETSPFFPAGTAQIHINADIAYALMQYVVVNEDQEFLNNYGYEMLNEIAKFYISYADYSENKGWGFNSVTGPDEYTALVNNNAYTNFMVKRIFAYILELANNTEFFNASIAKIKEIHDGMYIPRKENDLIEQCDGFTDKALWPHGFEKTPLLSHYHPMVIYKYQVLKQADLILAMNLVPEYFTANELKVNYDYYKKITTHDSSLSKCSYAQLASHLGDLDEAYEYFDENVKTDLFNTHKNTADGVHIASQAGSWQTIAYGFAGLQIIDNKLSLKNNLPTQISEINFKIHFKKRILDITVNHQELVVANNGEVLTILINNKEVTI